VKIFVYLDETQILFILSKPQLFILNWPYGQNMKHYFIEKIIARYEAWQYHLVKHKPQRLDKSIIYTISDSTSAA